MKHSAATTVALGAASAMGCASTLDIPPTLAPPVVTSIVASESHAGPSSAVDTLPTTGPGPRSVSWPFGDGEDSVQYMAAINVIASPASPHSAPTPTPV